MLDRTRNWETGGEGGGRGREERRGDELCRKVLMVSTKEGKELPSILDIELKPTIITSDVSSEKER